MVCVTLTDHESPMICRLYSKLLLWRCHLHEFIQDFPSVFSNSKIGGSCDFAWAWAWLQVWVVHGCGEYLNDLGNEDRAISLDSLVLTAAHRNHRGSTWCQGVWRRLGVRGEAGNRGYQLPSSFSRIVKRRFKSYSVTIGCPWSIDDLKRNSWYLRFVSLVLSIFILLGRTEGTYFVCHLCDEIWARIIE